MAYHIPQQLTRPTNIDQYDGTTDPQDHLDNFEASMLFHGASHTIIYRRCNGSHTWKTTTSIIWKYWQIDSTFDSTNKPTWIASTNKAQQFINLEETSGIDLLGIANHTTIHEKVGGPAHWSHQGPNRLSDQSTPHTIHSMLAKWHESCKRLCSPISQCSRSQIQIGRLDRMTDLGSMT
ncbi:hypothetical protein Lal_00025329 [Lupinus albus]|nr:hypothetical protein Lal_00025329 [Lupinus albus]